MPIRSPLRWFAALAIALSLSCRDATSPDGNRLALPDSPSRQVGSLQGPLNIPIADNNLGGAALGWTGTGLSVPPWTSYVVRIEGRTTVSSNPIASQCNPVINAPYGAEGSYGPSGDRYYQLRAAAGWMTSGGVASIAMNYVGYGTSGGDEAHSDTLFTWEGGQVAMSRSGIAGSTNGSNPPGCLAGLYLLSSSQTIALETFDDQNLTVTPSSVAVRKGTQVSFTATSGGTPVSAPHWRFDADSGVLNETGACGLNGPNPCLVTVKNSGRLRVAKNTQGRMRSTSARVVVYSWFVLDANRSKIVSGDTVTFIPKLDGVAGKAARWIWRGDDSSVVTAPCAPETEECLQTPRRSGTMWAYTAAMGGDSASKHVTVNPPVLQLTASKFTLEGPGEDVMFAAVGSALPVVLGWSFTTDGDAMDRLEVPSSSLGIRSASPHGSARTTVVERGHLFPQTAAPTHGTINPNLRGATLAAPTTPRRLASQGSTWGACAPASSQCTNFVSESGTVDVLAIVNGDTLRASVKLIVTNCPGDSVLADSSFRQRADSEWVKSNTQDLEYVTAIYLDSASNTLTMLQVPTTYADQCSSEWQPGALMFAGLRLVGVLHTHPPEKQNERIPYCGSNYDQYRRYDASRLGGGSPKDWTALRTANTTFKQLVPGHPDVPFYIIDGQHFYRLDPSTPDAERERRRKQWDRRTLNCSL